MEKGWLGSSEINRVTYDTEKVTLQQLEGRLQKAGTYIRTVPFDRQNGDHRESH